MIFVYDNIHNFYMKFVLNVFINIAICFTSDYCQLQVGKKRKKYEFFIT